MSVDFDGVDDGGLRSPSPESDGLATITGLCWFYKDSSSSAQTLWRHGDPGAAPWVEQGISLDAGVVKAYSAHGGSLFTHDSTINPALSTWTTAAFMRRNGSQKLWVAGVLRVSGTASAPTNTTDQRLSIGYSPAFGERLNGRLAHFVLLKIEPTAQQVADFHAGRNPLAIWQTADFVDYWPLDTAGATQTGVVNGLTLTMTGTTTGADGPAVDPPPGGTVTVGRDLALPWTLRARAGRDAALPWTIRGRAGADLQAPWVIRRAAGRDAALSWTVRGRAGADLELAWTIGAALVAVGRDLQLAWTVRAAAGRDLALPWTVRARAGRDLELPWVIRGRAGAELALPWTVRTRVGADLALPWLLRGAAGRDLGVAWTLRGVAGADLVLAWSVGGAVVIVYPTAAAGRLGRGRAGGRGGGARAGGLSRSRAGGASRP